MTTGPIANPGPADAAASEEVQCVIRPTTIAEFDERGYLAANPDIARAGVSAREHFLQHGRQEGRAQLINLDRVAALRERKLRKLRFNREPVRPSREGEPANFLSDAVIAEFGIPDSPPVSANVYSDHLLDDVRANPQKLYLDVGAGLRPSVFSNLVNTEIYPSVSTDVLCVGESLPFESDQFDFATCLAVLEHVRRPWEVAREICRVLKPGGQVLVDYPFLAGVHGYPHHYYNATPTGAIALFEEYCDIEYSVIGSNQHPMHAIWWLLSSWRYGLEGQDRARFEALTIGELLARAPESQLEADYCRNLPMETQRVIAAGSTLLATKRR